MTTRRTPIYGRAEASEQVLADVLRQNRLGFAPAISGLWAAGHSWLDTSTPPGVQHENNGLMYQLLRQLGVATSDADIVSDSGAQLSWSADTAGWVDVIRGHETGLTRTQWPYVPDIPAGLIVYGNNDAILHTGSTAPVLTAFPHALRGVIANMGLSRYYVYTDADITWSGGGGVLGTDRNKGAGWRQLTANGHYGELALPADWDGGWVQVWVVGKSQANTQGGPMTITVDGTTVDSFTTVQQGLATTVVPIVRRVYAPATATAVRVTCGAVDTNQQVLGFGLEAKPFPAVVVANIPRWVQYSGAWADVTDEKIMQLNTLLEDVAAEFPDSVVVHDLDNDLQLHPEWFDSGGGHLNELGASGVAASIKGTLLKAIRATGYPATWKAPA